MIFLSPLMKKYLEKGIFEELKDCLVYTERTLSGGRVRKGIIGAVDLEEYDFSKVDIKIFGMVKNDKHTTRALINEEKED